MEPTKCLAVKVMWKIHWGQWDAKMLVQFHCHSLVSHLQATTLVTSYKSSYVHLIPLSCSCTIWCGVKHIWNYFSLNLVSWGRNDTVYILSVWECLSSPALLFGHNCLCSRLQLYKTRRWLREFVQQSTCRVVLVSWSTAQKGFSDLPFFLAF